MIRELDLHSGSMVSEIFGLSFDAGWYAFAFYEKWLKYGNPEYTDNEILIADLFRAEINRIKCALIDMQAQQNSELFETEVEV